jgi:DNA adenine methylase
MAWRDELGEKKLTGLERAVAFWFAYRTSFNGTGHSYRSSPHIQLSITADMQSVMRVADRLKGVDIRNRNYSDIIDVCNKKVDGGVFFYLDPPYWETAGYSRFDGNTSFGWPQQVRLSEYCKAIDKMGNKFIQTNSAHEDLALLYKDFHIIRRDVQYTVASKQEERKLTGEFIISNFPLQEKQRSMFNGR